MHADVHVIDGDFGPVPMPLVLGHEFVGRVTKVGDLVQNVCVGDRVGVGPNAGSCAKCEACTRQLPVYCQTGFVLNSLRL